MPPMGASGTARTSGPAPGPPAYGIVAGVVLALLVTPLLVHAWHLPVGADAPYYVWSSRLAGEVGLSVAEFRPGIHGLLLAVSGATGLSVLQIFSALAVALTTALALAASVLAERGFGRDPVRSAVAGIAVGAYAAAMASGYVANLLFASLFVGAVALLVGRPRRPGAALAAGLLGTAGLAHGLFFLVGAAVLAAAGALRALTGLRRDPAGVRADLAGLGTAAAGGGAIAAVGFFVASLGRPLSEAERVHSRDGWLNSAGLGSLLEAAYLARWRQAARAFSLPVSVPLAAVGAAAARTMPLLDPLLGSVLVAWAGVTVAGVAAGLVTSELPPGRLLNFALVLPLLGAVGAIAVARWVHGRRRGLGLAVGAVLFAGLLFGPLRAWVDAHPFTGRVDLAVVATAGAYAERLPAGTPLVYVIDHQGPHAGSALSRYVNEIRMGLAADRQDDVHVFVGTPDDLNLRRPGSNGDPEHDGLARDAFERVEPILSSPHAPLLLRTFNQEAWDPDAGTPIGEHVQLLRRLVPDQDPPPGDPGAPSNRGLDPWALVPVTLGLLLLLGAVGLAWVRGLAPGLDAAESLALAPVAGAAAIVLASVLFDAVGLGLGSWGGPAVITALVAGLIVRGGRGAAGAA